MISKSEQIQIQYELAMSIGTSLDLNKMLSKSLTTILRKMNCPAGGVHFFAKGDDDKYRLEHIITIPRDISYINGYQKALAHIPTEFSSQSPSLVDFYNTLPLCGETEDGTFTIVEVPGLGVMVLLKSDDFDFRLIKSLEPIFNKLAVACNACLQNEEIVDHQNNLQKLIAEKTSELVSKNQQLTKEIDHRIKYEEALTQSEEKYRELVQNANSIILRWNTEGKITFFNEYAQTFFGFSEEEIIGRHVVGTIVPESESTGRDLGPLMDDICKYPQKYGYNVNENMRKDGSTVWVAWTNKVLTDEMGNIVGALSIGADVTENRKSQQQLIESEERYRALFTNEIDAICIFEIETKKIVDVNDAWLKLYGYLRDELGSLTISDVSAEQESTQQAVKHSAKTGTVFIPERHHQKKDGTKFIVELSAGPFTWKGQQLMYALVRDITERKLAEQELQRAKDYLENVLQNSPDGIGIVDKHGVFFKWNNAAAQLYGFSYDELAGKSFMEFYPDENELNKMLRQLRQSGYIRRYEIEMLRKDGDTAPFELSISLLKDENQNTIGSVCLARDLSETKKHLAELTTAYDELQRTKKVAEVANQAKSAFLANMSHELRTPLNAIIGFSELMTRDPSLSKGQLKDLGTIVRSGEYLLSLINSVLEFSKIEADQIDLNKEVFNLHQFLVSLEEMFHLRVKQEGLYLALEIGTNVPSTIRADQNKLRQILINLLGNAVKFTCKGGVTLRVSCRRPSELVQSNMCSLHFQVCDTGIGISPADQDKVFDAFFQTGERQSSHQGTGLGLAISKKFVSMMGGNLELQSEIGRETIFSFEIPVEYGGGTDIELSQPARRVIGLETGQPPFRLLVAEDNNNSSKLLVELLRIVGFEVREAINGQNVVEIWRQWQPHLIWMDMRMPVLDGFQATEIIKAEMQQSKTGIDTVIIALTASAFEEDRHKVIKHGCHDFVRKPFRESEIFGMLERYLGVKFVYDGHAHESTLGAQQISIGNLLSQTAVLSVGILNRLAESTELSDAAMIDEVIEDIRNEDAQLANGLSELAANFAYDEILGLVRKAKETQ